jgi:uncharacterized membrane protein YdjX (TVP38/TMEM64 family)
MRHPLGLTRLIAALIILGTVLLAVNARPFWGMLRNSGALRDWIASWGNAGPVVIVVLQAFQVVAAPVPGAVLGLVSGYLYGVGWGTLYSVLGTAGGSLIALWLARRYGRPLVERLSPPATLARIDAVMRRRGLPFLVLVFLLPFLPDDAACFVAGLTTIPIPALMLAVVAGRPPGIWVSCWLGANAAGLTRTQWAAVITASAVLLVPFLLYGDRLQVWALALADRLGGPAK